MLHGANVNRRTIECADQVICPTVSRLALHCETERPVERRLAGRGPAKWLKYWIEAPGRHIKQPIPDDSNTVSTCRRSESYEDNNPEVVQVWDIARHAEGGY